MALLSASITPTNLVTTSGAATLTNKTLTGAVMNGTLGATTPSTVVATTVQASTTIGVGGATPSASGSGITFPATQSASSDTNTLDDYEEGTWTPALNRLGSAPTLTYTTQTGRYTKIGNKVTVTGEIQINAITSAGSSFNTLVNLPFTAGTSGNNAGLTCLISSAVASDPVLVFATYNVDFRLRTSGLILTGGALQVDYVAGGIFIFSGSYLIS